MKTLEQLEKKLKAADVAYLKARREDARAAVAAGNAYLAAYAAYAAARAALENGTFEG